MSKAISATFFHAGCPICVSAERELVSLLDPKVDVRIVHLGEERDRIAEAERAGVQSVPALVVGSNVLHINFGASLPDLKNGA